MERLRRRKLNVVNGSAECEKRELHPIIREAILYATRMQDRSHSDVIRMPSEKLKTYIIRLFDMRKNLSDTRDDVSLRRDKKALLIRRISTEYARELEQFEGLFPDIADGVERIIEKYEDDDVGEEDSDEL